MERKAEIPSSQDPVIRATCEAYMIIASCDARCSLDTYRLLIQISSSCAPRTQKDFILNKQLQFERQIPCRVPRHAPDQQILSYESYYSKFFIVQAVYGLCDDYHGTMSINRGHEDTRLPLQVHQYNRDSGIWDYLYDIADRDGQFHLAWLKIRAVRRTLKMFMQLTGIARIIEIEKAQKRMKNYYDQRRQPAPHVFAGKIVWGQNPGAVPV
ncbi:hypothetical protein B0H11DRAFT_1932071 [Mycena galericulata]|nr:hypothetical protein B0H11DRAFT_1932071 [Mycena galericulata]